MKNILDCEEGLVAAVNQAESLLERSSTQSQMDGHDSSSGGGADSFSVTPLALSQYANFVAPTTSAPPEWRQWKPPLLDGRILPPNPKPEAMGRPTPDWKGRLIPSMFKVSWIQPDFGTENSSKSSSLPISGTFISGNNNNSTSSSSSNSVFKNVENVKKRPAQEEVSSLENNNNSSNKCTDVAALKKEQEAPPAKRRALAGFSDDDDSDDSD
jgi:hypothetical protein